MWLSSSIIHLVCNSAVSAPGTRPSRLPVCKSGLPAPGSGSRALCRQTASSGRDSIRCAHSGPSQRLLRPRCARTCIRRAPPPARVRGWTRPPAAASRRLLPSPCAKRPFLPPGPASYCLPCAKQPSLPPGPARRSLPCAKRPFLPPGPARRSHKHVSRRLYFGNSGIITIFVPVLKR